VSYRELEAVDGPRFMTVEVLGSEESHAAKPWGLETLCGLKVDYPMGKAEPTCGRCREDAGLPPVGPVDQEDLKGTPETGGYPGPFPTLNGETDG